MEAYKVALEFSGGFPTQFIAPWSGDPGRTCLIDSAKKYKSISSATFGLAHARKYRPFKDAKVIKITE